MADVDGVQAGPSHPRDGIGSAPYTHYHADYNVGDNTIYSGGDKESYLLLPIIPPK